MDTQRPELVTIDRTDDGEEATIVVILGWRGDTFEGAAGGSAGDIGFPRLVGEATLRAIEAMTASALDLQLEAAATANLGLAQVAMAQVQIGGRQDTLVGSALIRENDPAAATARAVLDAVNRMLGQVL